MITLTTAEQRKLLFEVWEKTGNVWKACRRAQVGRSTFYYWKPRFEKKGYAGLEAFESREPHEPHRTSDEIAQQVIELRKQNGDWGKTRIAKELAKANAAQPVVSPNTVRRILQDAGLWSQENWKEE